MKRLLCAVLLTCAYASAQQINPAKDIRWPLVTGEGAPSAACTSANYGQPYTNTTPDPNVNYVCGSHGWQIISSGGGGGGLSGQTINSLPLATSATASTISSHFTEAGGAAGVTIPFKMSSGPTCLNNGPTFTQWACIAIQTWDDGTSSVSNGLASMVMSHNAYGGGGGKGGSEGRISQMWTDSFNAMMNTSGIKEVHQSNTSLFGIGDASNQRDDHNVHTGIAYASDEGTKNYWRIGQPAVYWGAVIRGGTSTQPTFTDTFSCNQAFSNQACAPISGGWALDLSVLKKAGKLTSPQTDGAGPANCATWESTIATDQTTIPASAAYGCALSASIPAGNGWDVPISRTFTLAGGTGSFSVGDHACVMGSNFTEQNIVSAVSGSAGAQTITIPLAMNNGSVFIAKNDCMGMSLDADSAQGAVYALPAVSIDGAHIIYGTQIYGQNIPARIPSAGSTFSTTDGGANSGFHLYAAARILKVDTLAPSSNSAWDASNIRPLLSPNSAFSVGDQLYSPDYESQNITGLDLLVVQTAAGIDGGSPNAIRTTLSGTGVDGASTMYFGRNANATGYYQQYGGKLTEPNFMAADGVFSTIFSSPLAPLTTAFNFSAAQTGQTSYQFLHDPWLNITSDNTGTLHVQGTLKAVSIDSDFGTASGVGFEARGSGITNIGYGMDLANPSNGITWLTPCTQWNLASNTDLCITSQNVHNSGSDGLSVTANRGLQVGNLTINGTCTGCPALSGLTSGTIPIATSGTTIANGPITYSAGVTHLAATVNGEGGLEITNTANTSGSDTYIHVCGHTPGFCTEFYAFDSNFGALNPMVQPLSGYMASQSFLTNGFFLNTETTAPLTFGTNNVKRLVFSGAGAAAFTLSSDTAMTVNTEVVCTAGNGACPGNPSVGSPGAVQMAGATTGTFADSGCTASGAQMTCANGYQAGTGTPSVYLVPGGAGIANLGATSGATDAEFVTREIIAQGPSNAVVLLAPVSTAISGNSSSGSMLLQGDYWTGSVGTPDCWKMQDVVGTGTTPTSTLTVSHSCGSSGTQSVSVPNLVVTGTCTGCGGASTTSYDTGPTGFVSGAFAASTANVLFCQKYPIKTAYSGAHFHVNLNGASGANLSSMGFYTISGTTATRVGSLAASTSTLNVTNDTTFSYAEGTISLPVGIIAMCGTSAGTTLSLATVVNAPSIYPITNTGVATTAGAMPSTFTIPADTPITSGTMWSILLLP